MIKFYYSPAPNPEKVALLLEETGLGYEFIPVDTRKGEQFAPDFMALNPNAKLPVIVDGDAVVFDSNAILLYLAEKTGRFLPEQSPAARGQLLSWLMFVASGLGPYSGQAVHFKKFAPGDQSYAVTRYTYEAERHWGILDAHLADRPYMLGDAYGIVDMAVWGLGQARRFRARRGGVGRARPFATSGRRDQCPSGRHAGRGAQGQACLQDRNGRGSA